MIRQVLFSVFLLFSINGYCFDHMYKVWDGILKKAVRANSVQYGELKKDPKLFYEYVQALESVTMLEYEKFQENEKLAFLINSYNAFTVKLILDNYPVKTIKDIGGAFTGPWKKKFFKFLGAEQNLNYIENDLIRKKFDEPRIHFAIVCASKSCPALSNEAFVAEYLEKQLDNAANIFINDKSKNYWDEPKALLFLSKIFDWYSKDFKNKYGTYFKLVSKWISEKEETKKLILQDKVKVKFLEYDWGLNDS